MIALDIDSMCTSMIRAAWTSALLVVLACGTTPVRKSSAGDPALGTVRSDRGGRDGRGHGKSEKDLRCQIGEPYEGEHGEAWCGVPYKLGTIPHGDFVRRTAKGVLRGGFSQGRPDGVWELRTTENELVARGELDASCGVRGNLGPAAAWPSPDLATRLWRPKLRGESCRSGNWEVRGDPSTHTLSCNATFDDDHPAGPWKCEYPRVGGRAMPAVVMGFSDGVPDGVWYVNRQPWDSECRFGTVPYFEGVPLGTATFTDERCRPYLRVDFGSGKRPWSWEHWSSEKLRWQETMPRGLPSQFLEPGTDESLLAMIDGDSPLALVAARMLLERRGLDRDEVPRLLRLREDWHRRALEACARRTVETSCDLPPVGTDVLLEFLATRLGSDRFLTRVRDIAESTEDVAERYRFAPEFFLGSSTSSISIDFSLLASLVLAERGERPQSMAARERLAELMIPTGTWVLGPMDLSLLKRAHERFRLSSQFQPRWRGPGRPERRAAGKLREAAAAEIEVLIWQEREGVFRSATLGSPSRSTP